MFYRHEIINDNGEENLYIYINYDYEFANEITKISTKKNIINQVSDYIKKMNINFNGKRIFLMSNGIIVATLLLMNNKYIFNSNNKIKAQASNVITETYQNTNENKDIPLNENYSVSAPITSEIKTLVPSETNKAEESNIKIDTNKKATTNQTTITENKTIVKKPSTSTSPSKSIIEQTSKVTEIAPPSTTTSEVKTSDTTTTNKIITNEVIQEINTNTQTVTNERMITLYRSNGLIEQIALEDYIIGVVASEMPASFNVEALKAQAVVARTYALKRIAENKTITDTTTSQVYKDNNQLKAMWGTSFDTYYNKVKNAVTSTSNEVILYNNYYIDALYHSTSNGYTEDPINVWGGSFPYLKSVDSHWDLEASSYLKSATKSIDDVSTKLEINLTTGTSIQVLERSDSGRINKIKIDDKIFNGTDLYDLLKLRSRDFDMVISENGVTFTTRGYGHGVGMSQYGANGMAKEGYTYSQIINHYYQNVNIAKK